MATPDLIVRGLRVLSSEAKEPGPAAIHIRHGVIMAISKFEEVPAGIPIFDAGDSVVMAGLVDTHVHINEPGRTDWEGFSTATRAAAAGIVGGCWILGRCGSGKYVRARAIVGSRGLRIQMLSGTERR